MDEKKLNAEILAIMKRQYEEQKIYCDECDSEDLMNGSQYFEGYTMTMEVECGSCGHKWEELWKFVRSQPSSEKIEKESLS